MKGAGKMGLNECIHWKHLYWIKRNMQLMTFLFWFDICDGLIWLYFHDVNIKRNINSSSRKRNKSTVRAYPRQSCCAWPPADCCHCLCMHVMFPSKFSVSTGSSACVGKARLIRTTGGPISVSTLQISGQNLFC